MKKSEIKVNEFIKKLSVAYDDPAINKRKDLEKMILEYATDLDKTENVDMLSSKLCKRITLEYLSNKNDFPKSVIDLFDYCKTYETKYDCIALSSILLGNVWF